jgi:HAD superfamily hydrolase (TIGR01490 family)
MNLTIFDLDHTLIPLDSETEWLRFLARNAAIGAEHEVLAKIESFDKRFAQGGMQDQDYIDFTYGLQRGLRVDAAEALREQFVREHVKPLITPSARALVQSHQEAGDLVVLITGSSAFMTAPIVDEFGILHGIGTNPRALNGVFNGEIMGVPSMGRGKVTQLHDFLHRRKQRLDDFNHSTFYSDSTYDLPLLEHVKEPVAANPKPALKTIADERGWRVINLW